MLPDLSVFHLDHARDDDAHCTMHMSMMINNTHVVNIKNDFKAVSVLTMTLMITTTDPHLPLFRTRQSTVSCIYDADCTINVCCIFCILFGKLSLADNVYLCIKCCFMSFYILGQSLCFCLVAKFVN